MKLVRYGAPGKEKPGILDRDGYVRDLTGWVDDINGNTLAADQLDLLKQVDVQKLLKIDGIPQVDFRLGPCVGNVGKFVGIGLNYLDHAEEVGQRIPPEPIIFSKWTSSITGPDDDTLIPSGSIATDWEVELGVVIGDGGSNIAENDAMEAIAGYCLVNDISERDFQLKRGGNWDKGKGLDSFGPIGPWLVTKDEIDCVHDLSIWLEVNGARYQESNTSLMAFKVPFLVSYCSQFMSLQPGDIIATGTPAGVGIGLKPPQFMTENDNIHLGIAGLGTQTHTVTHPRTLTGG
ncbi:fumarylacetoacetate hydrolase family protein [Ruegeria sp. EL01]|jgi:2,4-diketo-3-deoxy-L-fuconate hydrolase|uniref:fumarylacetoacetate hydrolase family protein n=1 Tax=Ruegeria sp. EL01 TaxID=2107578 RepID=UPI000EA81FEF|nr:fumarylacetoacetate hydrolase family protein [Ruegeria sp. EL01]